MKRKLIGFIALMVMISLFMGCGKSPVPEKDNTSGKNPPVVKEETNKDEVGAKLSKVYAEMMKNKKYLMKYKMELDYEGNKQEVIITTAVSGDKTAINSISNGINNTIILKDDKTYIVNHTEKVYMELPAGMGTDEMETDEIDTDGLTYIGSGTEDGLMYEEYSTEDGKIKYYFDGNKLLKIVFEVDGEKQVMDIIEMSDKVPENIFEIPASYKKM